MASKYDAKKLAKKYPIKTGKLGKLMKVDDSKMTERIMAALIRKREKDEKDYKTTKTMQRTGVPSLAKKTIKADFPNTSYRRIAERLSPSV
jgi:NAD kinase